MRFQLRSRYDSGCSEGQQDEDIFKRKYWGNSSEDMEKTSSIDLGVI